MHAFRRSVLLLILLGVAGTALARSAEEVINYENNLIPQRPGHELTLDDVQHAISVAGANSGHWAVSESAPGRLKLIQLSHKVMVVVEVTYDTHTYSIHYSTSSGMHYRKNDGVELIHPKYNEWVQKLKHSIDKELL
jgi:hypothetical protein